MSGGRLVVLDRAGRDVKRFPLAEGLATLGSDPACDIRIMLPTVSPHHATVVVHANQTVVRNVCEDETLVNGRCVSVAALRHGDVISIGGRHLRWEYSDPSVRRPQAPEPALAARRRAARGGRGAARARLARGSGAAPPPPRDPALRLAIEMKHRASMPGSAGGKQVAIVQPQRRDTSDQIDTNPVRSPVQTNKRSRSAKLDVDTSVTDAEQEKAKRKSNARVSPKSSLSNLQNTTKATLWIESRKTSPRKATKVQTPVQQEQTSRARRTTVSAKKSTPLRLAVLKRAQSAHKMKVTKIQAPLKMDHTKQAAILLMTGHAAKGKLSSPRAPSPPSPPRSRSPGASHRSVTILEITDSDGQNSSLRDRNTSRRSGQKSPKKSTTPASPRKSALKDPSAKRGTRKTESIKFDLSNLENQSQDTDVMMVTDTSEQSRAADDDVTLRYSSSPAQSPSPRRSIHSRAAHILQQARAAPSPAARTPRSPATPLTPRSPRTPRTPGTPLSPPPPRSSRSSALVQQALSAPRDALESYSIVDLVSIDSDDSVYNSASSARSTAFGTPQNSTGRQTRSTIDPTLLGSSTPYVKGRSSTPRSRSAPSPDASNQTYKNDTQSTVRNSKSRRSKSLSTPENTEDVKKHISVNSTRISRASRSRSRINDSDLLLLDDDDDSPRTSKRISTTSKSAQSASNDVNLTPIHSPAQDEGTSTPENRHSPEEASTPVLSIQSLLDSSQGSLASQRSSRRGRPSFNAKRRTIGGVTGPKTRISAKSKSMSFSARKTRLRLSSDSVEALNRNDEQQDEIVTPKSAVKLVQEGVKNKHSTAKKPQSKRSIIDDLNESDIVKQLFNSPVKRKLSQSMTEFSRKQLFEDDDVVQAKRPTRNTIALTGRTPDNSLLDHTESYTPEIFVSPISTPTRSPSLDGIKLLFAKTTPENDLRNIRGVKALLRTPRTRRSIKNDLTNVSGVKKVFARSPKNRLSDVRVKEVFASSPKNDLRRVSGVKSLFHTTKRRKSPRNDLNDVRGVKALFKTKSPTNDLRNVSGVKRVLLRNSPKNDLTDVRGVKRMFTRERRDDLNDVSGVEELFNLSSYSSANVSTNAESLFDQLVGRPQVRAVYSKTFTTKTARKDKRRTPKSLHTSLDQITNSAEEWLEQELNKRLQIKKYLDSLKSANTSKTNKSKANKSKASERKSLHASLEHMTNSADEWLEQELSKGLQIRNYLESLKSDDSRVNQSKADQSKPNRSRANESKANMSRELQKLVTETVEGNSPICSTRIRNSTLTTSDGGERKRSASQAYSEHTLPLKKRSLVDASDSRPRSERALPLKKRGGRAEAPVSRAAPHSTPLKGRALSLSGAALARVSPIAAPAPRRAPQGSDEDMVTQEPATRPKSTRGANVDVDNIAIANAPEILNPTPKKTRGRPKAKPGSPAKERASKVTTPAKAEAASPVRKSTKAKKPRSVKKLPSPVPIKTTRSRRKDVSIPESNTKKRAATLVVTKKSPTMSPKPRATRKRKEPETTTTPKPSPKKTRATRKNVSVKDNKPTTPKTTTTRTRVHRATVVVSKPSPQLKPRATKTRARADQGEQQITKKTRNTVTLQLAQQKSPKESQVRKESTRASKTLAAVQSAPKTRGRKTVATESKDSTVEKTGTRKSRKQEEPASKKTKNNNKEISREEPNTRRTRGKVESQASVESADTAPKEVTTRKRKTTATHNDIPPKVRKSKQVTHTGRKRATDALNKSAGEQTQHSEPARSTRRRQAAAHATVTASNQPEHKPVRGRKANIENVPANQDTGPRKRGTAADTSPAEEHSKKQRGGKKSAAVTSPVVTSAGTRTRAQAGGGKTAGRSRRR